MTRTLGDPRRAGRVKLPRIRAAREDGLAAGGEDEKSGLCLASWRH